MAKPRDELTPKQKLFVQYYCISKNAADAARKAGYSPKTAEVIGRQNLLKVTIQRAIAENLEPVYKNNDVTLERWVQEVSRISFGNMSQLASWDAGGVVLKPSSELDDDALALVCEISETSGEKSTTVRVKLNNKLDALEKLAKHKGWFKDKVETNAIVELRTSRVSDRPPEETED